MKQDERAAPVDMKEERIAVSESLDDDDEPSTEALVEMLRQALHEANTGQTRPASEVMRELREMLDANADSS